MFLNVNNRLLVVPFWLVFTALQEGKKGESFDVVRVLVGERSGLQCFAQLASVKRRVRTLAPQITLRWIYIHGNISSGLRSSRSSIAVSGTHCALHAQGTFRCIKALENSKGRMNDFLHDVP